MSSITLSAPPSNVRTIGQLIAQHRLNVHFQPIVLLEEAAVFGHEALIRPPHGCPWPDPDTLFAAARQEGSTHALELECVRCAVSGWTRLGGQGKLFVNLGVDVLTFGEDDNALRRLVRFLDMRGISLSSVVIELTEHERVHDVARLLAAASRLRRHGVSMALDDFGDGRSSLRLWSELKPDFVKIDKYFTQGIERNSDKLQTLRALLQIAETFGTQLIAEGIETDAELRVVRDLGIRYGQGYRLGRPQAELTASVAAPAERVLRSADLAVLPEPRRVIGHGATVARLLVQAPTVDPAITHDEVFDRFQRDPGLSGLAVVETDRPIALINRERFIHGYVRPFFRELYGRRPALMHANRQPLTVELRTSIAELTSLLTSTDQRYLTEGFVIVEDGRYRGLGLGEALVRAVTEARIDSARHANPLTFLPGNVPIHEHIERLLRCGRAFVAGHADLNHFKPFNDVYGYGRGDEMIRLLAQVIVAHCDRERDFVGHVGGDDFMVLFQSEDWRRRCDAMTADFDRLARRLFDEQAVMRGGLVAEDREGVTRFHPCTTLSIGVVRVEPGRFRSADQVAGHAAQAKHQAKRDRAGVAEWVVRT